MKKKENGENDVRQSPPLFKNPRQKTEFNLLRRGGDQRSVGNN